MHELEVGVTHLDQISSPLDEGCRGPQQLARPDELALDDRVEREVGDEGDSEVDREVLQWPRMLHRWHAEISRVRGRRGAEAELEGDRRATRPFARVQSCAQAALHRERRQGALADNVMQQAQGPVQVRLSAAVRASDDVEAFESHRDALDGPVVLDGEEFKHAHTLGGAADKHH